MVELFHRMKVCGKQVPDRESKMEVFSNPLRNRGATVIEAHKHPSTAGIHVLNFPIFVHRDPEAHFPLEQFLLNQLRNVVSEFGFLSHFEDAEEFLRFDRQVTPVPLVEGLASGFAPLVIEDLISQIL